MSVKILATADLHIGRTSSNSEMIEDLGTTRNTWFKMVDYAISTEIDALLISGDVVEHANRYFEAASALEKGLSKLDAVGIQVILVSGNHDYDVLPSILKNHDFENIKLLGRNGTWEFYDFSVGEMKVQFSGWSFPSLHIRKDPLLNFPAEGLNSDAICIGLVHGDYENRDSKYAPLQHSTLTGKGMDVWVLGHIHKPETFSEHGPLLYYPGSPQALSPKEKGEHGAVLMTINGKKDIATEVIPFSSIRYDEIQVDVTDCNNIGEIREKVVTWSDTCIEEQIERNDFLKLLSLDLMLTGAHEDITELEAEIDRWDFTEFHRNVAGIQMIVRKMDHRCRAKIGDLEKLRKEPSPAGLLAQAILDLEDKKSSPFIEGMKKEMISSINSLNTYSTYLPIRDSEKTELITKKEIDQLLLQECNRLLSELIQTKQEG